MLESLKLMPLPMDDIPMMARKPLAPEAPKPLKMMAAKGALPIPPDALPYVWYQLSFDADEEVRAAVAETINTFDPALVVDTAQKDLPECILDWLAKTSNDPAVHEKLILNPKTSDATIMDMAEHAPKDTVELIANNHIRLLRAPEIIEKIYVNPSARMATVDKLFALAKEHNIELAGLKGVQESMNAAAAIDDTPGISDEEFEQILKESVAASAAEKPEGIENLREVKSIEEAEASETQEETKKRVSRTQIVEKMNAPQRIRLAAVGTREDRTILIRDARRVVYMAVITSPKMSIGEVTSLAASKNMPDEVIGYIAGRRDWVRYYPIVVALVNNPKCPLADALGFMKTLRANDLKLLQKSKNISATLARQAQMLYRQKASGK
ncbi:MAG: hypothetical protein IKY83_08505 [Proteobacteria bacterium]|nr:hypothetical protein [Pseudomonadota bacterium]